MKRRVLLAGLATLFVVAAAGSALAADPIDEWDAAGVATIPTP